MNAMCGFVKTIFTISVSILLFSSALKIQMEDRAYVNVWSGDKKMVGSSSLA